MSLYSKYRPKDWNSVVGQDLIVTILKANLEQNSTSHAYIFTGSRGTGKTTSARIFAKAINCTDLQNGNPCHKCDNCQAFDAGNMLDVIEIDAASNTGVENVRDLIEKAKFEPTQGKYKIYIIDEVHMLSTGAFNALLKTLEEPPKHVKFILATTEIHKVPETILSRVHRFDFHKISEEKIVKRLQFVCDSEGISYEEKTLETLAKIARGGMRNALTLLEQYCINNSLKYENLRLAFSILDDEFVGKILETLKNQDFSELQNILGTLKNLQIDAHNFFDQILLSLRDKMFTHLGNKDFSDYEKIFQVFQKSYSSLRSFSNGFLLIEITLMQVISLEENPEKSPIEIPKKSPKNPEIKTNPNPPTLPQEEKTIHKIEKIDNSPNISPTEKSENKEEISGIQEFSYRKLLDEAKSNGVLLMALKEATFKNDGNHLTLTFSNNWQYNQLLQTKNQSALAEILRKNFGGEWTIKVEFKANPDNHSLVDEVF